MGEKVNRPIITTYSRLANNYDEKFASYLEETFKVAMTTLALKGSERILDVACGTGGLEEQILKKFPAQPIVGIDITKSMLEIAKKKCAGYPNVRFLNSPAQKFSLDSDGAQFDIVITCSSFHYMRSPDKVLSECQRILVPGGRLIVIDWCRDFLWAKFYHWLSKIYKRSHYKVYTMEEMQQLITKANLAVKKTKTFSIPPFWQMMCVEARKVK